MTEELEKLIKTAPNISSGTFREFLIVPTNEAYGGFWGKNGYDNILILARLYSKGDDTWYKLCAGADIFYVYDTYKQINCGFNLDIPTEYGVPRIWFNVPIEIDGLNMNPSAIIGKVTTNPCKLKQMLKINQAIDILTNQELNPSDKTTFTKEQIHEAYELAKQALYHCIVVYSVFDSDSILSVNEYRQKLGQIPLYDPRVDEICKKKKEVIFNGTIR